MSQRNDNNNEFAVVFVIFYLIALAIAAYLVAVAVIVTIHLTACCVLAWNAPRQFENGTIFPEEARAFIGRGLAGAAIAPIITAVGIDKWDWEVHPEAWWFIVIGGYVVGSTGIQAMIAPEQQDGSPDFFPNRPIPVPPEVQLGPIIDVTPDKAEAEPEKPTFQFADWNDEGQQS